MNSIRMFPSRVRLLLFLPITFSCCLVGYRVIAMIHSRKRIMALQVAVYGAGGLLMPWQI